MSTYTMTLGETLDFLLSNNEITGTLNMSDKIEQGRTLLFDFDYPFFDETKRKDFETDFIRNFYTREIGFETENLFKFKLETWLHINIGYFNQLFKSELIVFDPLNNTKRDTTNNQTMSGTSHITGDEAHNDHATTGNDTTGTVQDDQFNRGLESDTPDSRLAITTENGTGVIEYASNIKEDSSNNTRTLNTHVGGNNDSNGGSNQTQDSNTNQTSDSTVHSEGKIGVQSYSNMLIEYRKTFLRIERQLFDEVSGELFMLVY